MKKIYRYIMGGLLFSMMAACSTDNALEDPIIGSPDGELPDGSIITNPYWSWVIQYPGFVSSSEAKVNGQVNIQAVESVWQSCGYYVVPGDTILVTVPAGITNLKCRVGGFSDELKGASSARFANMNITFDLNAGVNKLMSYFGGHLYFYYENDGQATTLEIKNVVKSPDYILGETDATEWKNSLATTNVPWGEMRSEHIILTLTLEQLRQIENPETFLNFYDEMIRMDYEHFFGVAQTNIRLRTDLQLTASALGANFGGEYPVVILKAIDSTLILLPALSSETNVLPCQALSLAYGENVGAKSFIVPFSQLNYFRLLDRKQLTTEFSSNWKSLINTHVRNIDQAKSFYDLSINDRVGMFVQLAQQYGWNLYPYVITEMKEADKAGDEQDKSDAFAMFATEYAGENLLPFFQAWGFVLSSYAIEYITQFPAIATTFWTDDAQKFGDVTTTRTPVSKTKGQRPAYTKIDRSAWTGAAKILIGTEVDNIHNEGSTIGPVAKMFDGDASTLWHSRWESEGVYYPQTITVDMKAATSFNYMYYRQRKTDSHANKCRRFQIYYKDNAGEWVGIDNSKIFTLSRTSEQEQYIYFSKEYTSTNLKLVLLSPHPSSGAKYSDTPGQLIACSIAEFGVGLFK